MFHLKLEDNMFKRLWDAWRKRDLAQRVRCDGWTGIYVGDYSTAPTWAYTIGFRSSLGSPEIVVFDLPRRSADGVFQEVFRQLTAGETVLADGKPWKPEEPGRFVWRKVHPGRFVDDEEPWLGISVTIDAMMNSSAEDFEAYQLVLSDADGRLPWEAGYDERLRPRQRALYDAA
ncbi:DUF4262 domain-containing protein [Phenylobacterium sp.]|uniref:DUF4262 domain-containing protein n=1 Tax=Phenylobacterium sp. TaxID=1871053 RepID=UPI00286AB7BF|nr:DUF4262 domain-containing protein [Phenylobacterium sp.]